MGLIARKRAAYERIRYQDFLNAFDAEARDSIARWIVDAVVEEVCPATDSGAVEAIREHVDTVMPRDGSLVDMGTVAASCERLWKAVHPDGGGSTP